MANNTTKVTVTFPGMFLFFLVLFVLKVTGYIAWSWWWVTAPLWGPAAALVIGGLLFLIVAFALDWWQGKI